MIDSSYLADEPVRHAQRNIWCVRAATGLLITGLTWQSPAAAQALDGDAIQQVALQGTWETEQRWGNWSWNADNTVCLRLFGMEGECDDTGVWTVENDVMCYEVTWWGETEGGRKNCFTVHQGSDGRYETRFHGGALDTTFYYFAIVE